MTELVGEEPRRDEASSTSESMFGMKKTPRKSTAKGYLSASRASFQANPTHGSAALRASWQTRGPIYINLNKFDGRHSNCLHQWPRRSPPLTNLEQPARQRRQGYTYTEMGKVSIWQLNPTFDSDLPRDNVQSPEPSRLWASMTRFYRGRVFRSSKSIDGGRLKCNLGLKLDLRNIYIKRPWRNLHE